MWTEPGMWPASHSERSRTSSTCRRSPSSQRSCSSGTVIRAHARDGPLLLAPRGHAAVQVAGDVAHADRGGQRRRRRSASASSRPTSTIALPGLGEPGQLGAEARAQRRDRRRRRGCAPRRTAAPCARRRRSAPSRAALDLARGRAGAPRRVSITSGPRLSATMLRKFGGCGPSAAVVCAHELVLVVDRAAAPCARARSRSSRTTLRSMPGPPHIEPPRWPGHSSAVSGSESSCSCSERKIAARALLLVDREVGPRDVADEQAVAGQHGPRLARRGRCRSARTRCARAGGPACAARGRAARRARAPSRRRTARAS